MNRDHKQRAVGFTLLEILVAMAVMSIALMAVMKTSSQVTANSAYLKEKTYAHWVALDRLAELRAEGKWPSRGTIKDTVEAFNQEWEWIQVTSETAEKDLRRVDVSVIHADTGDEDYPVVTMTAFFVNPQFMSNGQQQFINGIPQQ